MTRYFMGIDGGGSNLRVVVCAAGGDSDDFLHIIAQANRGTANPRSIGWDAARTVIQDAIREVMLSDTSRSIEGVEGVGIGIAGASAFYAADWLHQVVVEILPTTRIIPSSDHEIGLVGAHGEQRGIIVVAGTGSVAFGVNERGEKLQVGGWGYLLGDEGSGYWIGMEALRLFVQDEDGTLEKQRSGSALITRLYSKLALKTAKDLLMWVYSQNTHITQATKVPEIAQLAHLVLEEAERGDAAAQMIIHAAAQHLYILAQATTRRLEMTQPRIAFAGGLLQSDNPLSRTLCGLLGLMQRPTALYPPVVGAALLAKLRAEAEG